MINSRSALTPPRDSPRKPSDLLIDMKHFHERGRVWEMKVAEGIERPRTVEKSYDGKIALI